MSLQSWVTDRCGLFGALWFPFGPCDRWFRARKSTWDRESSCAPHHLSKAATPQPGPLPDALPACATRFPEIGRAHV